MRNPSDEWGLGELQNYLCGMLKDFHEFCETNDINYSVMGGTALGAIRHGGFIPWDDDIDIFMFEEEYLKFKAAFKQRGNQKKYYLEERAKNAQGIQLVKVRANGTTLIEKSVSEMDIHHGIFIDIFIINEFPGDLISVIRMMFWERYLWFMTVIALGTQRESTLLKATIKALQWIVPKNFLVDYARKQLSKYRGKGCPYLFHYYPNSVLMQNIYPSTIFRDTIIVPFEKIEVRCPRDVRSYLSTLYGDWQKIPDFSDVKKAQHAVYWSIDKEFIKRKKGIFEDEKFLI